MGYWEFNKRRASDVDVGITQRDQFNNDEVGLSEALVREVIQNSSDAQNSDAPVKVRFSIKEATDAEREEWDAIFGGLEPHLEAYGLNYADLSDEPMRVLAIEDFNTCGLTGSFLEKDKDNFDQFWRVMGDSQKGGKSGGRWGLGKLVYSSSSKAYSFFGLTVRDGDESPALMGQAVLKSHDIDGVLYPAHGFWFDARSPEPLELQLPVTDHEEVQNFTSLAGVQRTLQSGLSIIVPYLRDGVDERQIAGAVIKNYFFPILAGKLEVEVGDRLISAETFTDVVNELDMADEDSIPFDFIEAISGMLERPPSATSATLTGNDEIGEASFDPETLSALREEFSSGNIVHVRVPMELEDHKGSEFDTHIDLFMRAISEGQRPFRLFARGPIVLSGERRSASSVTAQCAMIANEGSITSFLGDAENPAHTDWNSTAEKLSANWRNPKAALKAVRSSLRQLYGLIGEQQEKLDSEALLDFFSIADKAQAGSGKKKKKSPKPKPDVPPRQIALSINRTPGGFELTPGPGAQEWEYPRKIRIRMAYDMIGANPFTRFSKFDFSLKSQSDLNLEAENASVEIEKDNVLIVTAESPEFSLSISGFDERRDLVVDARAGQ
ncbi:hypothetical protein [Oricola indica]|jgi:hypothetical protein|uniref:hypothetical protein n=1 Tax=Oricola indica TaxID=2872591 RepID=UPI001CBB5B8F|nr:hypothetical protein [Oricola indica]